VAFRGAVHVAVRIHVVIRDHSRARGSTLVCAPSSKRFAHLLLILLVRR
jgi:hypothetical protein